MRTVFFVLSLSVLSSCAATAKERSYTGSTPADPVVRTFLGIAMTDSVDFIRWQLYIRDDTYRIHVNYGIGKPNTNGFMNDGNKLELSGAVRKDGHYYILQNGNRNLRLAELNDDLVHVANADKSLLLGNGGWSYTLNSMAPTRSAETNISASTERLNDSMVFQGRTPCRIPGVIPAGKECYKLKWYLVLYADPGKNKPAGYKIFSTRWRNNGGARGTWEIVKGRDGRITYQLKIEGENLVLYLLKADNNILVFTDAGGKLLVGDEDFSYTLNRVKPKT